MDYSVICPVCMDTLSIETRSFEIAYPMDYESRIKKSFPDNCRKCGEAIDTKHMMRMPRHRRADLLESQ